MLPMAFAFLGKQSKRLDQIVAVDLGTRSTKAVHLQRKGETFAMSGFTIQDAPIFEKTISPELLTEHLKAITQALPGRPKHAVLVIGIADSLLRHAELPPVPVNDMRLMLKYGSKNYLQQDYPDHIFDVEILPPPPGTTAAEVKSGQKLRVLVGAAKKQLLDGLQSAMKGAGLIAAAITPSQIGAANAFEMAYPEVFSQEVVALVDLGFKNSSICILNKGELSLNRVVGIGGDKLTQSLSEALSVSYAEAEGIKVGLPDEVQAAMQSLLMPLGRELRASIDFFEHQKDKTVSQILISGGSARSSFIVESLQSELMVPCKSWNPVEKLTLELPPQMMAEVEQAGPQLTIAIGGALSAL
jgi:type IV pilus assembly protein PilM